MEGGGEGWGLEGVGEIGIGTWKPALMHPVEDESSGDKLKGRRWGEGGRGEEQQRASEMEQKVRTE